MNYATVDDAQLMWRTMTEEEQTRAAALIPQICAELRMHAKRLGKDLDSMVDNDTDLKMVAKSVVIDVLSRTLLASTTNEAMTQTSESAMGYSVSGTYLTPGGGIYIKPGELRKLGLRRQQRRIIDMMGGNDD